LWLGLFALVVGRIRRVSCGAALAGHYVQPQRRSGNVKPKRFYVLRSWFGGGRDILVYLMR
jgi:hypothetical protein